MTKSIKSFTLDKKVIDLLKQVAVRESEKEDRKVSESELVNKLLRRHLK